MTERRTPLYDYHLRAARDVIKGGGAYMYPTSYTSPVEEHLNVRRNVGAQDLSTMGEVDIKGPGSERVVRQLLANEVQDMEPGQLRYSTMCNYEGGILDDVTVYKFDDEHFMIVVSSGPRVQSYRWISEHARGASAYVSDMSAAISLLSVQGPLSRLYLKSVVEGVDLDSLRFFRFAPGRIGDVDVIVSRSGFTGELGYEVYCPADQAGWLWEHILQTGGEFEMRPYGLTAMQSLRIEKALPLYGPDIKEEYTPFHLGLESFIRLRKREFIGRKPSSGSGAGSAEALGRAHPGERSPGLPERQDLLHRRRGDVPGDRRDRRRGGAVRGRVHPRRKGDRSYHFQHLGTLRRKDARPGVRGRGPRVAGSEPASRGKRSSCARKGNADTVLRPGDGPRPVQAARRPAASPAAFRGQYHDSDGCSGDPLG